MKNRQNTSAQNAERAQITIMKKGFAFLTKSAKHFDTNKIRQSPADRQLIVP
jgi:hypothetical protein